MHSASLILDRMKPFFERFTIDIKFYCGMLTRSVVLIHDNGHPHSDKYVNSRRVQMSAVNDKGIRWLVPRCANCFDNDNSCVEN